MSIDKPQPDCSGENIEENDHTENTNADEEINGEIGSEQTKALNENQKTSRSKNPHIDMDIDELVETIKDCLILTARSFERKLIKKVTKKLSEIETTFGKNVNTPLLFDLKDKIEVLEVALPMDDPEVFTAFDLEVSGSPEKIEALVNLKLFFKY